MPPHDWLDTVEKLSRILSIVAIPVVLGVGGWLIQRRLQDQTIRRDYVKLAVSILRSPDPSKVPPEMRDWAVDLLSENAPTRLNADAIKKLKSGAITLSGFSFVPSSALTPDLQQELEASLRNFKVYLVKLGFRATSETISVKISPGITVEDLGAVALWDPSTHSISVASAFATDETSVLRQLAYAVLEQSGGRSRDYFAAIESGLATYFPCSFTDHPMLGDQASADGRAVFPPQDLRTQRKFVEIEVSNWASAQNDGSEIWGGALWQIRELLGAEGADQLIARTWQSFSSTQKEGSYVSFANAVLGNSQLIENGKYTVQIRQLFRARGLSV